MMTTIFPLSLPSVLKNASKSPAKTPPRTDHAFNLELLAYKRTTRASFLVNIHRFFFIFLHRILVINSVLQPIRSMSSALSLPTIRPAAGLGSLPCHAPARQLRRPRLVATCSAFRRDHYGGVLVDEGMAVLRRRIREARMAETNNEAPPGWAAWEKRYYPAYVSDISALAGALQLLLMGTRPTVAIAAATLLLGGVPVSAAVALHLLGQAAGTVLQHVP
uniref:Uncharacterized protein n=1 Tax=Avena sativa TaxID=4498 RepID=A0ACD5VL56_AVESA